MKLAAIYNVFDGTELLIPSMRSVAGGVDIFIIVFQTVSNFGETRDPFEDWNFHHQIITEFKGRVFFRNYNPTSMGGFINEKMKRQIGIETARKFGASHFLHMDCDELWHDFAKAKDLYVHSGRDGSVANMYTYFSKPTLRLENFDNYFVPFIHKLKPETTISRSYPFYVDRTRMINTQDVVLISEPMHHFSWVRKDVKSLELKVRNSSARENIKKSSLIVNWAMCGPGTYLKDYKQSLIEVDDLFGIGHLFGDAIDPVGIV